MEDLFATFGQRYIAAVVHLGDCRPDVDRVYRFAFEIYIGDGELHQFANP